MTKKEIVKTISEQLGLTQLKTKEIVQQTFEAIIDTLVDERRIELRNFGVFEVKERAARKARNPRTGEKVDVPAKFVVTFKPGKEMEDRVQRRIAERKGLAIANTPDVAAAASHHHHEPRHQSNGSNDGVGARDEEQGEPVGASRDGESHHEKR